MLLKVRDPWSSQGDHIVSPLDMYTSDRGGERLYIVFAKAAGQQNDVISVMDMTVEMAERAINDAAKAGLAVVDMTPEGCEIIKKKYAAPAGP